MKYIVTVRNDAVYEIDSSECGSQSEAVLMAEDWFAEATPDVHVDIEEDEED